jgi:hypothetical protein
MYCEIPLKAPGRRSPLTIITTMKINGIGTVIQTTYEDPCTPLKIAKKMVAQTKMQAPKEGHENLVPSVSSLYGKQVSLPKYCTTST